MRRRWNPQKSENMTKGVQRIRRISPRTPDASGANCPCNSTLTQTHFSKFGLFLGHGHTRDLIISAPSASRLPSPLSPPYGASCVTAAFANSGIAQRTTSTTLLNYSRQKMPPKKKKMWKTGAPPKRPPHSLTHSLVLKDASNEVGEEKLGRPTFLKATEGRAERSEGTRVLPGAYIYYRVSM